MLLLGLLLHFEDHLLLSQVLLLAELALGGLTSGELTGRLLGVHLLSLLHLLHQKNLLILRQLLGRLVSRAIRVGDYPGT